MALVERALKLEFVCAGRAAELQCVNAGKALELECVNVDTAKTFYLAFVERCLTGVC